MYYTTGFLVIMKSRVELGYLNLLGNIPPNNTTKGKANLNFQ